MSHELPLTLAQLRKNERAIIREINESRLPCMTGLQPGEIEASLLEMGFIEGAQIQVLHLGGWSGDPIALRINNNNKVIALRRNEAFAIVVERID